MDGEGAGLGPQPARKRPGRLFLPWGVAGVRHGALEKYGADTGPHRALPRCSAVLPHSQPQSP